MKKKILAVILAVMMLVCTIPFGASAANDGYVRNELLDNSNYYHMEYVEKENYFKNTISLYTALGFYDHAWYNYFDKSVDIDYAKGILLSLIEQVEAQYNNQTFEEVMKILGGAKTAMEVIQKVGDISQKFTDVLDFTQAEEWGDTIGILGTAIKAANYGNEIYKAYVKGYAMILSAKAASAFYGDFLTYIANNCENEAVREAAVEIAGTIDKEMQEAVDELVQSLVADAGKDAATIAAEAALDSYGVTAAIKGAYKTVVSLSDKLLKTKDKYEYMISLVETCYIEDCFGDWAKAAFESENADFASFAGSTVIAVRACGEKLLANLANAKTSALVNMIQKYDATEIKVRTAAELAKLDVAAAILDAGDDTGYTKSVAVTGNTNVALKAAGAEDALITVENDIEVPATVGAAGAYTSVYNEGLGEYVKAFYLKEGSDYDVVLSGAAKNATAYAVAGKSFGCIDTTAGRVITLKNVISAPSIVVADPEKDAVELTFSESFVKTCDPSVAVQKETKPSGGSGSSSGSSSSSGSKFDFGKIFSDFFKSIIEAFKSIFNIFKK